MAPLAVKVPELPAQTLVLPAVAIVGEPITVNVFTLLLLPAAFVAVKVTVYTPPVA